ncbi:hypothetical protein VTO73DRAFT_4994 [Trametes versicolor]
MAVPVDGYVVCAFDGITTFVHRGVSPRRIATHSSVDANLSSANPLHRPSAELSVRRICTDLRPFRPLRLGRDYAKSRRWIPTDSAGERVLGEAGINTEGLHVSSSVSPKVPISYKCHAFSSSIQEAPPSAQHHDPENPDTATVSQPTFPAISLTVNG